MRYQEICPSNILSEYVQCYFTCETDIAVVAEDKIFATGVIEIMFNLGSDGPQKLVNGGLKSEPAIQLWGQTIQPFTFASYGRHEMLGIRFFTHTAAFFFEEPIAEFNNQVIDFNDVAGTDTRMLHDRLLEAKTLNSRIVLLEQFLLRRLARSGAKLNKLKLVNSIMQELTNDYFLENINFVASRYGMSSRYLQTIFLTYSGLSPVLFAKIARFQKSLHLVVGNNLPLTAIAHHCGYYDQSHFIKDFKFFTGSTPSRFSPESSTDLFVSLKN
jgi:AraC-like DNA-binding protein